jgi:hypothetical protein
MRKDFGCGIRGFLLLGILTLARGDAYLAICAGGSVVVRSWEEVPTQLYGHSKLCHYKERGEGGVGWGSEDFLGEQRT